MSRFFKSQFENYLNISAKNDYLDKIIKERKSRMEICLYHYRVANKDAQNSYEHITCLKVILFQKVLEFQNAISYVMDGSKFNTCLLIYQWAKLELWFK